MSLLKPLSKAAWAIHTEFTFHYVSIKTLAFITKVTYVNEFTFHYVSIKTFQRL